MATTVLFILQETCTSPVALLHKLEILMNLVWERLNTGHWAKVIASPLGRNTHWVLFKKYSLEYIYWVLLELSLTRVTSHPILLSWWIVHCKSQQTVQMVNPLKVWPGWRKLYALLAVARVQAIAQLVLAKGNGGRVLLRY